MATSKGTKGQKSAIRPSTLPFCDDHLPPTTLSRFAVAAGVPASALNTVNIHRSAAELVNALLQYTAMYAISVSSDTPLLIDSLKPPIPIGFEDFDDPDHPDNQDDSDDPDDPDDSNASDDSNSRNHRQYNESKAKPRGRNSAGEFQKQKAEVPEYKLGYGECSIVWPPPPEISAKALWEKDRLEKQSLSKIDEKKLLQLRNSERENQPIHVPASSVKKGAAVTNIDKAGTCENDGEKKQLSFFIAHKTLGEPQGLRDVVSTYDEIFVATAASRMELNSFLEDVISWNVSRLYYPPPRRVSHSYHLHRFKLSHGGNGYWNDEGRKPSRPPSSVILSEGQMDAILKDISTFLSSETDEWYSSHGLEARRSYLFFGPPGTGKTSTIRAIASEFRRSCCFLSMANSKFSNQALGDALSDMPENALIVLEDVDALFTKRKSKSNLTFSGLLNALDGVMSADGVITIMTTNHIEKLDEALLRGGRVDRRFYFGPPEDAQLASLFRTFYPHANESVIQEFVKKVSERPAKDNARSIATLQELFIYRHRVPAEECVSAIDDFFETFFPFVKDLAKSDGLGDSEEEDSEDDSDDEE